MYGAKPSSNGAGGRESVSVHIRYSNFASHNLSSLDVAFEFTSFESSDAKRVPQWRLRACTLRTSLTSPTLHPASLLCKTSLARTYKRVMRFIHCHTNDLVRTSGFSGDCLHAMSAKIVRRLHKLRASEDAIAHEPDELLAHADAVLERASVVISGRWRRGQLRSHHQPIRSQCAVSHLDEPAYHPAPVQATL